MASGIVRSGVIPITEGGTGKNTATEALTALDGFPFISGVSINPGYHAVITISSTSRFLICLSGHAQARQGLYMAYGTASSAVFKEIAAADIATVTASSNKITVTNTNTGSSIIVLYILCLTNESYSRISVGTPVAN